MKQHRPHLNILDAPEPPLVVDEAADLLSRIGVSVENEEARRLLLDARQKPVDGTDRIRIARDLVETSLSLLPRSIRLFDRNGVEAMVLEGDRIHFDPGSAATKVLDSRSLELRPPTSRDAVNFAMLTDALPALAAQSTCVIPTDIPIAIADRYRLYIALTTAVKPVITGTFVKDAFAPMREMLEAVRGGKEQLREKPLAIFDCCPSPPLKWSDLTCQCLIDCARAGIPSELVSMPLAGATSPVTLYGAVVQHAAENLSGIVIAQLASPGSPVIFGGSPSVFDMKHGTTPMGAIETMMIDCACAQVGKHLGLVTHAYMGLSDSKLPDMQAGLEGAMGSVLGGLAGINVISGPGMLDFESAQSMEKLVIDHEICAMVLRLVRGVAVRPAPHSRSVIEECHETASFLAHPDTLSNFRSELHFAGPVIERAASASGRDAFARARDEVSRILFTREPAAPEPGTERELQRIMAAEARKHGVEKLPV